jgi:putative peptidoglycan lipid II flippase
MATLAWNPVIDNTMTSWLGPGSVSILNYAERLYMAPLTIVSYGMSIVILSHWSESYYNSDYPQFKTHIKKTAFGVGSTMLVCTVLLAACSDWAVPLVLGYGSLSENELGKVSSVLICYLAGLAPALANIILVRARIVMKDTKWLFYLSIAACMLNVIFNYALMKTFGVLGIALSTSATYFIIVLINGTNLMRKLSLSQPR